MKKIYELITEEKLILKPPLKIDEVIKQFSSKKIIWKWSVYHLPISIKCCSPAKTPKIAE